VAKKVLWDGQVLGLALVITPAGNRSWWFVPRRNGKQVWVKVGEYHRPRTQEEKDGVWSLEAARAEAGKLRKLHDEGKDVRAVVEERRTPRTFDDLLVEYKQTTHWRELAPASRKKYLSYFKLHVQPLLGSRLVKDISYRDIVAVQHAAEKKGFFVTAANCVTLLSNILAYAMKADWRERGLNPAHGVETTKSKGKDRTLTVEELALVGNAIGEGPNADVIRFLAVSGLRIGEAVALEWKSVDLEGKVLTIDKHKTMKHLGPKKVPINPPMEALLKTQAGNLGRMVFPGRKVGTHRSETTVQWWWKPLAKKLGIGEVTPHDFRRTFVSTGGELGFPPSDMDILVGHKLPGVTGTYYHLKPNGILAQASNATAAWIAAAMNGEKPQLAERVGAELEENKA